MRSAASMSLGLRRFLGQFGRHKTSRRHGGGEKVVGVGHNARNVSIGSPDVQPAAGPSSGFEAGG